VFQERSAARPSLIEAARVMQSMFDATKLLMMKTGQTRYDLLKRSGSCCWQPAKFVDLVDETVEGFRSDDKIQSP
jgi:hypothetical protein